METPGSSDPGLRDAQYVLSQLRAAAEDQLDGVYDALARGLNGHEPRAGQNPALMAAFGFMQMVSNEKTRRRIVLHTLDAEMSGGHLVFVYEGSELDTFAAFCDPEPDSDTHCWTGPDRITVEDALEDGRAHHPGYEPTVEV